MYLNHKTAEEKICISLNLCVPKHTVEEKKANEVKKVLPKKIIKKEVLKKETPKKIIKKKVPQKVKKRVIKAPLSVPILEKKIQKPKKQEEKVVEKEEITEENIVEKATKEDTIEELDTTSKTNIATPNPIEIEQKKYIDDNIEKISQLLIENLYYPRRARKRGITGEVIIKFNILQDGTANTIKVISSNSEILSRAATKTIKDLSGEFPKPSQDLTIQIPIKYSLH